MRLRARERAREEERFLSFFPVRFGSILTTSYRTECNNLFPHIFRFIYQSNRQQQQQHPNQTISYWMGSIKANAQIHTHTRAQQQTARKLLMNLNEYLLIFVFIFSSLNWDRLFHTHARLTLQCLSFVCRLSLSLSFFILLWFIHLFPFRFSHLLISIDIIFETFDS